MKLLMATLLGTGLFLSSTAQTGIAQPAPQASHAETFAPMVLNGYSRFPRNIGTAPVYDLNGHRVGLIQKLDADPTGKPSSVEIWLPPGRSFTVAASNISYDAQQNVVTAGLTDAQLGIPSSPPRN